MNSTGLPLCLELDLNMGLGIVLTQVTLNTNPTPKYPFRNMQTQHKTAMKWSFIVKLYNFMCRTNPVGIGVTIKIQVFSQNGDLSSKQTC